MTVRVFDTSAAPILPDADSVLSNLSSVKMFCCPAWQ